MADNLSALIARAQALLLDTGSLFSTATCTAAARQALQEWNQRAPVQAGTLLEAVPGQKEYALNAADFTGLLSVLGVWRQGEDEIDMPLAFDAYFEDNAPFIRLREAQPAGMLIVRYSLPHTLAGLDGAVESTLSPDQEQVLVEGIAAAAILIRLSARVETINLAPEVVQNYDAIRNHYRGLFETGLAMYAARRPAVGEPDLRRWNDPWHGWEI